MLFPDGWSPADVAAVVESVQVTVDVTCEVDDGDGGWSDVTGSLLPAGSSVTYRSGSTVHREARLTLSSPLDWDTARVRVSMTVGSPDGTFTVPVGTFATVTPDRRWTGETPGRWDVECVGLLWLLDDPAGETVVVGEGGGYLEAARTLIEDRGLEVLFSAASEDRLLSEDRVFALEDGWTTLEIVNHLLEAVGFRRLWVDAQGRARSEPVAEVSDRPSQWNYRLSGGSSVAPDVSHEDDRFDTPNRFVATVDDPESQVDPVTLTVDDGRPVRTVVESFDVADGAALAALAADRFDELRRVTRTVKFRTSPNPCHAHRDVVRLLFGQAGVSGRGVVTGWQLPLDGSDMELTVELL